MRLVIAVSAIVSLTHAQQAIAQKFPTSCTGDITKCTGDSLCCRFTSTDGAHEVQHCMTASDRGSAFTGSYTDDNQTPFNWNCPKPETKTTTTGAFTL